jgi:hypothetical protein
MNVTRNGAIHRVTTGRPGPEGARGAQGPPGPPGNGAEHLFREFSFADLDNPVEIGAIPAGYIASRCVMLIKTGFPGTSFAVGTDDDQDMLMTVSEVIAGGVEKKIVLFADKAVASTIRIFPSFIVPPGFGTAEAIIYYSKEKV